MKTTTKTILKNIATGSFILALIVSQFPVGTIIEYFENRKIVDVMWEAQNDKSVVDMFLPPSALAATEAVHHHERITSQQSRSVNTMATVMTVSAAELASAGFEANDEVLILFWGMFGSGAGALSEYEITYGGAGQVLTNAVEPRIATTAAGRERVSMWMGRADLGGTLSDIDVDWMTTTNGQAVYLEKAEIFVVRLADFGTENEDWFWNKSTTLIQNTTTYSNTNRASVTWDPANAEDWVALAYTQIAVDSGGVNHEVRLMLDGSLVAGDMSHEGETTAEELTYFLFDVASLDANSHTYSLETRDDGTGVNDHRESAIFVFRKDAWTNLFVHEPGTVSVANTTDTQVATITDSFASAQNAIMFGEGVLNIDTLNRNPFMWIRDGGSTIIDPVVDDGSALSNNWSFDGTDELGLQLMAYRSLSSGAQDLDLFVHHNGGATENLALTKFLVWGLDPVPVSSNTTTIADGTDPGNSTVAPGSSVTDLDAFTLTTDAGTDTVTGVTVTLSPSNATTTISKIEVTNNSNTDVCTDIDVSGSTSNVLVFSGCSLSANTSPTTYKVRITPKTHANMPAVPGASYAVTGTVTSITGANSTTGTDTDSAIITIDNLSPDEVTSATASAGDTQVGLSWTNPGGDFDEVVVLRTGGEGGGGGEVGTPVLQLATPDWHGGSWNGVTDSFDIDGVEDGVVVVALATGGNNNMPSGATMSGGVGAGTLIDSQVSAFGHASLITYYWTGVSAGSYTISFSNYPSDGSVNVIEIPGVDQADPIGDTQKKAWDDSGAGDKGQIPTITSAEGDLVIGFSGAAWGGSTRTASHTEIYQESPWNFVMLASQYTVGASSVNMSWTPTGGGDWLSVIGLSLNAAGGAPGPVEDVPVEGTNYSVGNTIGSATVACVTSSTSCTDTSLTNGVEYYYKIFTQDTNGNYSSAGVVPTGSPVTPVEGSDTTTLATGTDPSSTTVAPSSSITDAGSFSVSADAGTDSITALTVTLADASTPYNGVSEVRITSNDGSTTYFSAQTNPGSNTVNFSGGTPVPVTTTPTQYKIRITPKTHANMPAVPGASYALSPYVSAFTTTNDQAGSDTNSNTLTIDNASPAEVTSASASAGDEQAGLAWTNPADGDFDEVVVLRRAGSAVTSVPVEGTEYDVGNTIGSATVACVTSSTSCTDTSLSNGTAYHYEIFTQDTRGNYSSAGVVPSGSPATPFDFTTTLSDSSDPSNSTIAPGASVTDIDQFTFTTNIGTDSITALTVQILPALATTTISKIEITNTSNVDVCTDIDVDGTTSNVLNFSCSGITATTGGATYKIRITPKSHANMPAVPGASYAVTATTTDWTGTNTKTGTDTDSATITIDNLSPDEVTGATASAGNTQVSLSWTNPGDGDLSRIMVLASTTAITFTPVEGTTYATSTLSGASRVACYGLQTSCVDTSLSNGTAYYYKIYTLDSNGNWSSTGVDPSGSPATPLEPTTTLGDGTDPSNSTIAPGASATTIDEFTFTTNTGSDSITALTVQLLPSLATTTISKIEITNTSNADVCTDIDVGGTTSNILNFTCSGITATTGGNTYRIRITPLSHANMPGVPGASYAVTATTTDWTGTNTKTGTDTDSATITIDNLSPAEVTSATASVDGGSTNIAWTNPADSDFDEVVVLRTGGGGGAGSVTYDNSSTNGPSEEGTSFSWSHTVGSGDDRALVVGVSSLMFDPPRTVDSVTYNGVAMTEVVDVPGDYWANSSMWILVNPPVGTHTVEVTMDSYSISTAGAVSFFGVDQADPIDDFATLPFTESFISEISLELDTTSDNGFIVDTGIYFDGHALTPLEDQTERWQESSGGCCPTYFGSTRTTGTAGTYEVGWTFDSNGSEFAYTALALKAAASSAGPVTDVPVEGTNYSVGNTIGSATVVCVTSSTSCVDSDLDTTDYYYEIFAQDDNGNYSPAGVVPTGSPVSPVPILAQNHYIWRSINGTEVTAQNLTAEDTPLTTGLFVGDRVRLRMGLANTGSSAQSYSYLLEHASSSCSAWYPVPTDNSGGNAGTHWMVDPLALFSSEHPTTNIAGLSKPGGLNFTSGYLMTTSNTTPALSLREDVFTEVEFALRSTSNAVADTTYCFRLTNNGATTYITHSEQPQVSLSAVNIRPSGGGRSGYHGELPGDESATPEEQGGGQEGGGGEEGTGEGSGEGEEQGGGSGGGGAGGDDLGFIRFFRFVLEEFKGLALTLSFNR